MSPQAQFSMSPDSFVVGVCLIVPANTILRYLHQGPYIHPFG